MTNGMQVEIDDVVGGPPPADPPPAGPPAVVSATVTSPAVILPATTRAIGVRSGGGPARRRPPLTVIPRRVTGTHTAIPALTSVPAPAPHGTGLPPGRTPASAAALDPGAPRRRRRRAGLLGGAALVLAAAVALPLWVDRDQPVPSARQAAPIDLNLPAAPGTPPPPGDPALGGPSVGDPSVGPAEPTADATSSKDRTSPGPTADPTASTGTVAPAAPATSPAPSSEDTTTQEPTDQGPPAGEPTDQDAPPVPAPTSEARGNPTGRNLALGQRVFASSFTNRFRSPDLAVDGKLLSKWSTRATDQQWLAVDLGDTFRISRVRIAWELAFANTYRVELSSDGRSWTSVWQTRTGLGGTVGVPMDDDATARFVRVFGVRPAGPFGYSIRELDVR